MTLPWPSARPTEPYAFLVWWHCGYPASDAACARGWAELRRTVGTAPEQILKASQAKLAAALKAGGMVPELRAQRLQQIASRVQEEFGGDLRAASGMRELLTTAAWIVYIANQTASCHRRRRQSPRRKVLNQ